jgi:glc operon protein GlcG
MIAMAVMTNGKVAASGGAAPVFKGNEMVGCYGISGATSDQDEVIGQHARAKVAWAHLPDDDTTPAEVKKHINELNAKAGIRDREL